MNIKSKYSQEINEITYRLKQLEQGRFTENTNANCDGLLATNVQKLRNQIFMLLAKIETNSDSETDELKKIFNLYVD